MIPFASSSLLLSLWNSLDTYQPILRTKRRAIAGIYIFAFTAAKTSKDGRYPSLVLHPRLVGLTRHLLNFHHCIELTCHQYLCEDWHSEMGSNSNT